MQGAVVGLIFPIFRNVEEQIVMRSEQSSAMKFYHCKTTQCRRKRDEAEESFRVILPMDLCATSQRVLASSADRTPLRMKSLDYRHVSINYQLSTTAAPS
jgi:hypothetical protein